MLAINSSALEISSKIVLTNKKDSAKMLEFASEGTRKRMGKIAR